VDEETWIACAEPREMLRHRLPTQPSGRKLRLWACAYARRVWKLLDGWAREIVEAAERWADGETGEQLEAALEGAWLRIMDGRGGTFEEYLAVACADPSPEGAAVEAAGYSDRLAVPGLRAAEDKAAGAALLRRVVGNPFRPSAVDLAAPGWNGGAAVRLAEALYQERAFDRLPILGDLLEEAAYTDPVFLAHCRGPGPHARGCFVDALTGHGERLRRLGRRKNVRRAHRARLTSEAKEVRITHNWMRYMIAACR
jgi:hypothetical protein